MAEVRIGSNDVKNDPEVVSKDDLLSSLKNTFNKIFGKKSPLDELKKDFSKSAQQMILLNNMLKRNNKELEEMAKNDKDLAKSLELIEQGQEVANKIARGETDISKKQAREYVDALKASSNLIESNSISLKNFGQDVIDFTENMLSDNRLSQKERNEVATKSLQLLQSNLEASGKQSKALEEVIQLTQSGINLTEDNLDLIKLGMVEARNDVGEVQMMSKIGNLNDTVEELLFSNQELNDINSKQIEGLKGIEAFMEKAGTIMTGDVSQGILGYLASAFGMTGIEQLLPRGAISSLVGSIFTGKYGIFTVFKGKVLPKLVKLGAKNLFKLLGKGLLIGQLIYGLFKGVTSFLNPEDILGEGKNTIMDRIQAGALGLLSGLTFGLFSPKQIKKVTDSIANWMSSNLSKLTDPVFKFFEGIFTNISNIFDAVMSGDLSKIVSSISNLVLDLPKQIFDLVSGVVTGIIDTIGSLFGVDDLVSKFKSFVKSSAKSLLPSSIFSMLFGDDEEPVETKKQPKQEVAKSPDITEKEVVKSPDITEKEVAKSPSIPKKVVKKKLNLADIKKKKGRLTEEEKQVVANSAEFKANAREVIRKMFEAENASLDESTKGTDTQVQNAKESVEVAKAKQQPAPNVVVQQGGGDKQNQQQNQAVRDRLDDMSLELLNSSDSSI